MEEAPYQNLTPDLIFDSIERCGIRCSGQLLALNSYENRVYQIGVEDDVPIIAKFYRPGRWSDQSIIEEHEFTEELAQHEIPAVPPFRINGATLHHHQTYRYAIYQRRGGRAPELDQPEVLTWIGRFLGRIHAVGSSKKFAHRPTIDVKTDGDDALSYLLVSQHVPDYLRTPLKQIGNEVLRQIKTIFQSSGRLRTIRLHGDCHPGNILWTDSGPHFVDFDDSRTGPAIADIWMLLSGEREEQEFQLNLLLKGYTQFNYFDAAQLHVIEALRGLRIINYCAWLARRWNDPAFPLAFPWFDTPRYWENQIQNLHEQLASLQEPALRWDEF